VLKLARTLDLGDGCAGFYFKKETLKLAHYTNDPINVNGVVITIADC
jgi:hypothetical protein